MAKQKTLLQIHEDVPADHYDASIKRNYFQKYWHWRRFAEIQKVVKPVEGAWLDVGCHSGTFTEKILAKIGSKKLYGIDVSPSAIKKISKRFPFGKFEVANAHHLPYKDNTFEAVFCLEMLEHVDDPVQVLSEVKRVLKKNGYVVALVPTDNFLFRLVWFIWTTYYPVWRHAHVQSFRGGSLPEVMKKVGLKVTEVKHFHSGMLMIVVAKK